jgi:hypothetical protein
VKSCVLFLCALLSCSFSSYRTDLLVCAYRTVLCVVYSVRGLEVLPQSALLHIMNIADASAFLALLSDCMSWRLCVCLDQHVALRLPCCIAMCKGVAGR